MVLFAGVTISGGGINIVPPPPPVFGGTSYGYSGAGSPIQRWSFASDSNAVTVGTLAINSGQNCNPGQASETYGYVAGNNTTPTYKAIQKYSFATGTENAVVSAQLALGRHSSGGASSKAQGYGYVLGGDTGNPTNNIEKFSFTSDTNGVSVGTITGASGGALGLSSGTNGYATYGNTITKFPFATDTNAVVSASLSNVTSGAQASQSSCSTTDGFVSGIYDWPNYYMGIQKFSFSSDTNSANVGSIRYQINGRSGGSSSTTFGYQMGGYGGPIGNLNKITKFPYAAGGTATDVGTLTVAKTFPCGTQV